VETHEETGMHDMIGASGMVRGWAALWHMELVWLLAMLAVSVAATALVESLFASVRLRLAIPKFVASRVALGTRVRVVKLR
jgi:hypothetical protein